MRILAGRVWQPGRGFVEGWLEDGAFHDGRPPRRPDITGWVMPAPLDAHTHVGDRALRGQDLRGLTLAQVVAPPDGLKHRLLGATPRAALVAGMRAALRELDAAGTRAFLDFREGGPDGVAMLREALGAERARATILGRGGRDEELRAVLDAGDGIGFSGLADAPAGVPERAAALAHARGKMFAIHFSEDKREDAARALALGPAFLVHGTKCERGDLDAIARARVPIVLCPRSNALFGGLPDVPRMLDAGVALALGSDNAMFHALDVVEDARLLKQRFGLADATLLDMLVGGALRPAGEDWVVFDGDPLGAAKPSVVWRSWSHP